MRAQAHTLEAFVAAVLIVGGLIFATQVTAVTPLSASTSNQHIENQQQATVEGLLATAVGEGELTDATLYWNTTNGTFEGAPENGVYAEPPPNAFGTALDRTLAQRQIAFNVDVRYALADGGTAVEPMIRMGEPSANAVVVTRTVAVYNASRLTGDEPRQLHEIDDNEEAEFYAPDLDASGQLYNVFEVEVTAWRK